MMIKFNAQRETMIPIRSLTRLFIRFCLFAAMAVPCKARMKAEIRVYFNGSVELCFRNLEENKVVKALVAARNRGAKVRFICDDAFEGLKEIRDLRAAGIPVISDRFLQPHALGQGPPDHP
jgi:hypothetical protein